MPLGRWDVKEESASREEVFNFVETAGQNVTTAFMDLFTRGILMSNRQAANLQGGYERYALDYLYRERFNLKNCSPFVLNLIGPTYLSTRAAQPRNSLY